MLTIPFPKPKTTVSTILRYEKSKVLAWIEFSMYEFESLDDARRFCLYKQCSLLLDEPQTGMPIIESFKCFTIKEGELYGCLFKWVVVQ